MTSPSELPPTSGSFYVAGGTLPPHAPSYVPREADRELLRSLKSGDYCYVLNARQMGKSSLCVRTLGALREAGAHAACLDLTKFGGRNLTAEQWYAALVAELGRELGLRSEFVQYWKANPDLPPVRRLFAALTEVALPAMTGSIVVFVDEIDVTRSLPFNTDEFFAAIRQLYVGRATEPQLARLSFCLLGTATPADLIEDTRISPFNIGRRIELHDFTPAEAAPLAAGLGPGGERLLGRVLYWTNGHPYLTQRLCRAAGETGLKKASQVDLLAQELFLTNTAREADDNLALVRNRLLKSEVDLASLLTLYQQVRDHRHVPDDETDPLCAVLKLSGIVAVERGRLRVRNRIYEQVFDPAWVTAHLPGAELRRQREAFQRGVTRTTAWASVVLSVVGGLAVYAFSQKQAADRNALAYRKAANEATQSGNLATQNQKKAEIEATKNAVLAEQRAKALKQERIQHSRADVQTAIARAKAAEARDQANAASAARQVAQSREKQALYNSTSQT